MFKEIQEESFSDREARVLNFWKENDIFQLSLTQRKEAPLFSTFDGPPFATGLPHYGHILAGTIKDVVLRFKTMEGFYVPRRFGWDCHGLPIEQEIEKLFNLSGAPAIEAFGIANYNEECRKIVLRFTQEWRSTVERMGRWVDFSQTYRTMDCTFMESVWWVFKQIFEKGLIYEGFKVMPFSAKLGTPLSNFEATENYQEVDDPSIVVALPLVGEKETSLLVWTTTPWTLISNLAATVHGEIVYATIEDKNTHKKYILAEALISKWFKEGSFELLSRQRGIDLVGREYVPPFSYFSELRAKGAFKVIEDNFVSLEEGTGIVHTAPAFGETDFFACQKAGIPLVCPVDQNCRFTKEVPEFEGMFVKNADKQIIAKLKEQGILLYRGTIHHRYPYCWRSDTPLIYKAITTWFLDVGKIKDALVAGNQTVHWVPEHIRDGRFGKWLEGARDWAISRNRYWGTPIPLWRNEEGDIHVVGSIQELETLTGVKVDDLHRHYIDHLTFTKAGKVYKRIPEVFDCWFDAGSMPYAQNHYPFENKEETEKAFPADFIAEGIDQTRGWFYTLSVIATALFEKPAFKHVIANGIVLAEDGNKMSKRLKNYPEPVVVIDKYGADAIRLYLLNSPAVKADDVRFVERGVEQVLRQVLLPLWNAHSFFITYARIYHWKPAVERTPLAEIDRWILAKLQTLIKDVKNGMDLYDLSMAVEPFVGFIDALTNWYIRRSRRRFWAEEESVDRSDAFATLYHVLLELTKIAAPFIPFLSESIYSNIRDSKMPLSVHLCDYPEYREELRDSYLESGMELVQTAVSLGHALRKEHKIKVRQPLMRAHVECHTAELLQFLRQQEHLIADELNVKEVCFHETSQDFVKLSVKPNFRVLGKKVQGHMKEAQLLISQLKEEEVKTIIQGRPHTIMLGGHPFQIISEDIEITRTVHEGVIAMHAGSITIALDTALNRPLILEGIARELINKINTLRREREYKVTDRIKLALMATPLVIEALDIHGDYLKNEVLAVDLTLLSHAEGTATDINGEPTVILVERIISS
jgi:isoleucyl-tRNA synthetase